MELRDYQTEISNKALIILNKYKIVYLAMEVRTGKTLTSLNTAKLYGAKNVLFLTKKKAISSIEDDYKNFGFNFNLTVINDESIHKITDTFDLIIHDEHHRFGAFPKPNKNAKIFKQKYSKLPMIFLSGTPHAESYSQIYHQFWVSDYSPFIQYTNFYKWANDFVDVKLKKLGYATVKDYSNGLESRIIPLINNYIITLTQAEAGFKTNVIENILYCEMKPITYKLIKKLFNDLVIKGKEEVVLADTGAKLQSKAHQLYSGTVKFESGKSKVIDNTKGLFIKEYFKSKKIGIYYKFKEELKLLKDVFGENITEDLTEFNNTNKNIALQFVSGREGISLKNADCLVAFNIDFSAVTYWQFKDRMTTKDRLNNKLYWVFSNRGIEDKIYKSVQSKKNYTLNVFKKDYK